MSFDCSCPVIRLQAHYPDKAAQKHPPHNHLLNLKVANLTVAGISVRCQTPGRPWHAVLDLAW